ncbi:hypothetical protein D3C85_1440020 [compost metagenome]
MSEVTKKAKVLAPPAFPKEGRLPGTLQAVGRNYGRQTRETDLYKQSRNEQGRRRHGECCQAVHISLFFDGTHNNEKNDTEKGHPTHTRGFLLHRLFMNQVFYESRRVFIKDLYQQQKG